MKITCETKDTLPLSTLIEFQGGLKIRTNTDVDKIITSIKKYGFFAPFFVWKHDGVNHVLDGHGRLTALKKIAKTENVPPLPVVYVDCNDEEDARNKLLRICSQYGKMTEESVLDFMGDFNFDFDELQLPDGILEIERPQDEEYTEEELDEIPEEVEPVCKLGDIWELGEHRLICGDSSEEETYKKVLGDEKADMVFTDPPYGINYSGGRTQVVKKKDYGKLKNDDLQGDELGSLLSQVFIHNKRGADVYICVSPVMQKPFLDNIENQGKKIDAVIVWDKKQAGLGYMAYRRQCEFILFIKGEPFKKGDISDFDLWSVSRDSGSSYVHGTQKPVLIPSRAIKNSSKVDDIVLDLFGGSGSTLIACEQLNRKCRMIELDPMYCDVIIARWEQLTGKTAKKLDKPCKEEAIGS